MPIKIGLVSLGCEKNRVDAEMMLYSLKEAGYEIDQNAENADVVIINTCGFIRAAKEESIDEIFNFVRLKEQGKIKAIVVTGCLSERYKHDVMKEIPQIDAVVGIGALDEIVNVIEKVLQKEKSEIFKAKENLNLNGKRLLTTPRHYAYLKIADGCSNCCTYCAIPIIRGKYRSRKMEDIIAQAKELVQGGARELILIAQDTTRYGQDIYDKLMLPELLRELCKIEDVKWIRLLYCYPERVTDELIETIASEEKILNYIDLPLQHVSENILKMMNRTGNAKTLRELINKLRAKIPNIVLRTTFIVGFPSETEENFEELCDFANEMQFDRMGCFTYSPEENTKAALFENQISEEIKLKRQEILMEQQNLILERKCNSLLGKNVLALIDGFDETKGCLFGRSYMDLLDVDIRIVLEREANKNLIGTFKKVQITSYDGYDLYGKIAD